MAEAKRGYVGVDLDGTLAIYDGWKGDTEIGAPIWSMIWRVQDWLKQGYEVRVFTARVSGNNPEVIAAAIQNWCLEYVGVSLPVTCKKDYGMIECWDDRSVQVIENAGEPVEGSMSRLGAE